MFEDIFGEICVSEPKSFWSLGSNKSCKNATIVDYLNQHQQQILYLVKLFSISILICVLCYFIRLRSKRKQKYNLEKVPTLGNEKISKEKNSCETLRSNQTQSINGLKKLDSEILENTDIHTEQELNETYVYDHLEDFKNKISL
jgi:hypothetical protein